VTGVQTCALPIFSGNTASANGGALESFANGPTTVTSTSFTGNSAANGGGVFTDLGIDFTLTSSTFSGNKASSDGGAILNGAAGDTILTITRTTITANTAGANGGGIDNVQGTVTLTHSTVTGNTPGNCAPANTIAGCAAAGVQEDSRSRPCEHLVNGGGRHMPGGEMDTSQRDRGVVICLEPLSS
jgi:predicted outer membrane repeat protein